MKRNCAHCAPSCISSDIRAKISKAGRYRRKSDCSWVQKYRCLQCGKYFSSATFQPSYRQNKRQFNHRLNSLLCSNVSLRRAAKILGLSRTTVARKLDFLGTQAQRALFESNLNQKPSEIVEFDDLETWEHTKMKPLSVTLAVESRSRRILGFQVSRMPTKGKLAKRAFKKYGHRKDDRSAGRIKLLNDLKPFVLSTALFKSDENPHYIRDLKLVFPNAVHERYKGQRGSIVGQGELKKVRFDPLFSLNHTCAMLRANVNRLIRRTWCTTKLPEKLALHLAIYAVYHNLVILDGS